MSLRGFYKILLATLLLFACGPAFAGKRVALVLGNSAYQNVPRLTNPANDAALMADTFKKAGFDVVVSRNDLGALETRRVLRDFSDSAADADIAVIYYAGHGIEVDGTNYLIPVDAKLERDNDVFDEAFSLERVMLAVEPAKKLRLVILDACRDNPFSKTMKRTVALRAIGRGLAQVEPAGSNTLIAYAAKAGSTAQDGDGKDSPFTIALSRHLTTPGLDVRKAFGFVRDDVIKATASRQEPFVYGSLGGDDVPLVPAPAVAAPAAAAPNPQADQRRDYELALQVGNKSAFNAFIAQHPDGFYTNLARLQLEKLAAEEAHARRPRKQARPRSSARVLLPQARKRTPRPRPTPMRRPPRRRSLPPRRPSRSRRIRLITPSASARGGHAARARACGTGCVRKDCGTQSDRAGACRSHQVGAIGAAPRRLPHRRGQWRLERRSQRSLSAFNRNAGTRLDVKTANADTLDAIKQKPSRVCPLVCEHGFKADGDNCVKIVCAEGMVLNDDNSCEKRRDKKPVATREAPERKQAPRQAPAAAQGGQSPYGGQGGYGAQAPTQASRRALPVTRSEHRSPRPAAHRARPRGGLQRLWRHHVGGLSVMSLRVRRVG